MTNDEKVKAYDMALEAARKELGVDRKEWEVVQRVLHNIFPQLHESEDERIRKGLIAMLSQDKELHRREIAYLEKQKEPEKEELVYRLNGLMQEYINEAKDQEEEEHRFKCYKLFWDALEDASYFEQKEQKPAEYIPDSVKFSEGYKTGREVGFREGVESVKSAEWSDYKDKVNVPYCSSEPEWSEEDEKRVKQLIYDTEHIRAEYEKKKEQLGERFNDALIKDCDEQINWLKSLRPSWKPSEDEERLINTAISFLKDFADKGYENAVECIDWLKSKLNGNSNK